MELFDWANRPLEERFKVFQELVKRGWKIQLEQIDQIDNGYWCRLVCTSTKALGMTLAKLSGSEEDLTNGIYEGFF